MTSSVEWGHEATAGCEPLRRARHCRLSVCTSARQHLFCRHSILRTLSHPPLLQYRWRARHRAQCSRVRPAFWLRCSCSRRSYYARATGRPARPRASSTQRGAPSNASRRRTRAEVDARLAAGDASKPVRRQTQAAAPAGTPAKVSLAASGEVWSCNVANDGWHRRFSHFRRCVNGQAHLRNHRFRCGASCWDNPRARDELLAPSAQSLLSFRRLPQLPSPRPVSFRRLPRLRHPSTLLCLNTARRHCPANECKGNVWTRVRALA